MHPCVSRVKRYWVSIQIHKFEWAHLIRAVFPITCKGVPFCGVHVDISEEPSLTLISKAKRYIDDRRYVIEDFVAVEDYDHIIENQLLSSDAVTVSKL